MKAEKAIFGAGCFWGEYAGGMRVPASEAEA